MVYSVQVKRLKNEDPLEALVLRGSKRKRRQEEDELAGSDFVFRLAHTLNAQQPGGNVILESSRSSAQDTEREFHIAGSKRVKKQAAAEEPEANSQSDAPNDLVPPELQSMLADYIKPQQEELKTDDLDKETEDYVYDVYFSEKAGLPAETQVGYIVVHESEERLLFGDSDSDSDLLLEDEDDSNAEDYYRNDYPEEEDVLNSGSDASSFLGQPSEPAEADEWSEDETEAAHANYRRYGWS